MISRSEKVPITSNIENVKKRIEKAAINSGRNPDEIKLIAVSKQFEIEDIIDAFKSGHKRFGENYPQEFRDKYKLLVNYNEEIEWHFIGHLQKNKIKYVIGKVALIHSLDNFSLAQELDKKAKSLGQTVNVLIEINSGEQQSKTGIKYNEADDFFNKVQLLDNIKVKGFMTIPPFFNNPQQTRPYFKKLRQFRDNLVGKYPDAKELSMGLSGDFEVAIEEGATYIRLGTSIFGNRKY